MAKYDMDGDERMEDASLVKSTGKIKSTNGVTGFTGSGIEDAAKRSDKLGNVPGMGANVHGFSGSGIEDAASKGGKLVGDYCNEYVGFEGNGLAEAGKKGGKLEKF